MFHQLAEAVRLYLVPDRPWYVAYAPPAAVAVVDHGASWVTVVGLGIGLGGLACHVVQTALRVREHLDRRPATAR